MLDEILRLKILPAQCSLSHAFGLGLELCEGDPSTVAVKKYQCVLLTNMCGSGEDSQFCVVRPQSQGQLCTGTQCPVS